MVLGEFLEEITIAEMNLISVSNLLNNNIFYIILLLMLKRMYLYFSPQSLRSHS